MTGKTLVVIGGPTAVGKTAVAIELAKHFTTEIISADSRQFYREMTIGTAKPTNEERQAVRHHFIDSLSIHDYYNAWQFEQDVLKFLETYFKRHDIVFLTGGSGLYIDAVCHGLDDLPTIKSEIRQNLLDRYEKEGIEGIRFELKQVDPEYYLQVDLKNPQRILHALEIFYQTGKKFSVMRKEQAAERPFKIVKIIIHQEREILYERINDRVDKMIEKGLIKEAKLLYSHRQLSPLQTVGYRELFDHFDGRYDLEEAVRLIKRNTRHYARRQISWFKRDPKNLWIEPNLPILIKQIEDALPV
ncbi:MAG: tRNA (adenosine(37)-N6)-dimethylallyltransferase MiaA [Candidatus Zixiibacteriota bacterium]|nr:MAG: tRNA (adenosine(37)-N6)-dimethylallyltransferase MiaA [candidate division Zixibacteria bacterium]